MRYFATRDGIKLKITRQRCRTHPDMPILTGARQPSNLAICTRCKPGAVVPMQG